MLKKYYLFSSIALFFLSGCASLHHGKTSGEEAKQKKVTDRDIAPHVLAIDPDGKLNLIGCNENGENKPEWCEDSRGKNEEEVYKRNLKKYLDNIITKLNDSGKEILIYIHGGLNSEKNALERVKKKYRLILEDKENSRYPVFINWKSGPITTYTDHLWQIRQGEKEEDILKKIISWPVYLFTDIGNSIVNTPKSWITSGVHSIDSIKSIERIENTLDNQINAHKTKDKVNVQYVKSNEKPSQIGRAIQWLLTSPSKVITTPFTYTMAKPAWDIMLRRTSTLFYTESDLEAPRKDPIKWSLSPERKSGSGALYHFLDKIGEETTKDITLIGHSMGAIVVNNIVNLKPNLPYKNIVHMASADSIENLFNKVVPCLYKSDSVKFYSLYLHPDNENREVSWGGTVPSGSLLTWIDGMYTTPKTVLDKRSGRWDNMTRAIRLFPEEAKKNIHFTIFGIEERIPYQKDIIMNAGINLDAFKYNDSKDEDKLYLTAQKHGEFGDLPFWREEIWKGDPLSAQGK